MFLFEKQIAEAKTNICFSNSARTFVNNYPHFQQLSTFSSNNVYNEKKIKKMYTKKKKEVFICLEFLGKISLQSKKQLTEIVHTCLKNIKLNVVFRSSNRIRNVFRFKYQIPKYMNSKVIYEFIIDL